MTKLWKPFLLLAAVGILAFGLLSSGAWFTDGATSGPTTITAGTLSIDDAQLSTVVLPPITNMAPGDITDPVVIVIKNNGNLPLAWFGNLMFDNNPLKDVIYIEDAQMEFLTPTGGNWAVEGPDHFVDDGTGAGLYPAWLQSVAATSPYNVLTLNVFDGNNGMGSTPWEFMGALKPGYSYKLTLRFGFVGGAGNEYQAQGPMNITMQVNATQLNPGALDALQVGFGTNHPTWLNAQIADQTEP